MELSPATRADIDAIRRVAARWTEAVGVAALGELEELMSGDIVVIHGDGRTLIGKDAVLADFAASFRTFRVQQQVAPEETIVDAQWAFERARVRTVLVPRDGGTRREFISHTLTVLRKDPRRGWCVARAIGVVEQETRDVIPDGAG